MQQMSGLDAAFLYLETPTTHMHVVGVVLLDPSEVPGRFGIDVISRAIEERLHLIPPFRRRVLAPPAGIDHPLWIEDPGFDLGDHVRAAPLRRPVTWADLEAFTGQVASLPLDRNRPLWEMWVVEGMADGAVALVTKLHHAIMDGAAGGELMTSLFDLTPDVEPVTPPSEPWEPDRPPSAPALVGGAMRSLAIRQKEVPASLARTARGLADSARTWASQRASGSGMSLVAPRTLLNGATSAARSVSLVTVGLDEVKTIRRAFGTTVNDVVLAAAGTTLRRYLEARGPLPEQPLVAAVPVNARAPGAGGELGNQVSSMMVPLALSPDDPVERLRRVHDSARSAKDLQSAFGTESLRQLTALAAPPLMVAGARLYSGLRLARFHRPLFNVIVSNVPGPPIDLYCAGARVDAIFPMGPVMEGSGLNITVLSEADHLDVGVMACSDLVDSVEEIGNGFVDAVVELRAAAGRVS